MAQIAQVEAVLADLVGRFERIDLDERRAVLPSPRVIELVLRDLDVVYHTTLEGGALSPVRPGPAAGGAQIRLEGTSDDLLGIANGTLRLTSAYASGRLRVNAPMTDLLRLTALL